MAQRDFLKMQGLGNDFVVVDARARPFAADAPLSRALADRRTGIGCDQLIVVERPHTPGADVFMRILNADGREVDACGNATRCIARWLYLEEGLSRPTVETNAGLLVTEIREGGAAIAVDIGLAADGWRAIPLSREADTLHLPLARGPLSDPVGVSVGNPHVVFFVPDPEAIALEELGPAIEHDALFPQRTNVEVVGVESPSRLRMRVWERGVGITRACGTGACAAAVAAHRRGLTGRSVIVELDGGELAIEWRADGHVVMTGPAAISFTGSFDEEAWRRAVARG
ncbi:MAG: diaminopimelate epimerase [Alphaproteobacteria bacterium]|nr:diaminopimelate epimerase [Alphaproteobacteria bacterium]